MGGPNQTNVKLFLFFKIEGGTIAIIEELSIVMRKMLPFLKISNLGEGNSFNKFFHKK